MNSTKVGIGIIGVVAAIGIAVALVVFFRSQSKLKATYAALQKQEAEAQRLSAENARLNQEANRPAPPPKTTEEQQLEMLRLRGEVGKLRQTTSELAASKTNAPSALSGLTANPEMHKVIRDQQKAGLSMIYQGLTNRIPMSSVQLGKLGDLLADDVMENIDRITEVLKEGRSPEQMEQVFAAQEAALREKVQALLSPEEFAQYQDYTRNLATFLTAEQFKGKFEGDKAARDEKAKQLYQLLREEAQQTLGSAGLSPDYQLVPTLNFRNFASEAAAEQNLKLLDGVYERAAARAGSILTPGEIASFNEFRNAAITRNRMALSLNRQLMMPGSK